MKVYITIQKGDKTKANEAGKCFKEFPPWPAAMKWFVNNNKKIVGNSDLFVKKHSLQKVTRKIMIFGAYILKNKLKTKSPLVKNVKNYCSKVYITIQKNRPDNGERSWQRFERVSAITSSFETVLQTKNKKCRKTFEFFATIHKTSYKKLTMMIMPYRN